MRFFWNHLFPNCCDEFHYARSIVSLSCFDHNEQPTLLQTFLFNHLWDINKIKPYLWKSERLWSYSVIAILIHLLNLKNKKPRGLVLTFKIRNKHPHGECKLTINAAHMGQLMSCFLNSNLVPNLNSKFTSRAVLSLQ